MVFSEVRVGAVFYDMVSREWFTKRSESQAVMVNTDGAYDEFEADDPVSLEQ